MVGNSCVKYFLFNHSFLVQNMFPKGSGHFLCKSLSLYILNFFYIFIVKKVGKWAENPQTRINKGFFVAKFPKGSGLFLAKSGLFRQNFLKEVGCFLKEVGKWASS